MPKFRSVILNKWIIGPVVSVVAAVLLLLAYATQSKGTLPYWFNQVTTTPLASQLTLQGSYRSEGFISNRDFSSTNDSVDWWVHTLPNGQGGWKIDPDRSCFYRLHRELPPSGGPTWFFQLDQAEKWGQGGDWKPGIDWSNPPRINNPTPQQVWDFVTRWYSNPTESCRPGKP